MADTSPPARAGNTAFQDYLTGNLMYRIIMSNDYFHGLLVCLEYHLEREDAKRTRVKPRDMNIIPLFDSTHDLVVHLACAAFVAVYSSDYGPLLPESDEKDAKEQLSLTDPTPDDVRLYYRPNDLIPAIITGAYAKLHDSLKGYDNAKIVNNDAKIVTAVNHLLYKRPDSPFPTPRGETPYIEAYFIDQILRRNADEYYQAVTGRDFFAEELRKAIAPNGTFPGMGLEDLGELAPGKRYDFMRATDPSMPKINRFVKAYFERSARVIINNARMLKEEKMGELFRELLLFLMGGFISIDDSRDDAASALFTSVIARIPDPEPHPRRFTNAASRFL